MESKLALQLYDGTLDMVARRLTCMAGHLCQESPAPLARQPVNAHGEAGLRSFYNKYLKGSFTKAVNPLFTAVFECAISADNG